MKIANVDLLSVSRVHLRHPATQQNLLNAKGEKLFIAGYGPHTEQYKRITRQWQNETLRNRKSKMTAEQLESRGLDLLSAITAEWNLDDDAGHPLALTPETARQAYIENPWAKDQLDEHVHDQANYVGESFAA